MPHSRVLTYTQRRLAEADERKQEGTEHFRARKYNEALVAYRSALGLLPRRAVAPTQNKGKAKERAADAPEASSSSMDALDTADRVEGSSNAEAEVTQEPALSPLEEECAKARAVLNANIGACYVKLASSSYAPTLELANTSTGRMDRGCERMYRGCALLIPWYVTLNDCPDSNHRRPGVCEGDTTSRAG